MPKTERRYLKELEKVLYDQKLLRETKNFPVYYIQRGVKKKNGLRYDITTIPAKMLGREFPKTKGNRNSKNYQELYTVLEGKAIFLMQEFQGKNIKDVIAAKAEKKEWVIVPPRYYVISINPSKKILKLGNWVSKSNKNIYKDL